MVRTHASGGAIDAGGGAVAGPGGLRVPVILPENPPVFPIPFAGLAWY
ncbi:MAG: hypothetical protein ABSB80_11115 [Methanoregula sp.]